MPTSIPWSIQPSYSSVSSAVVALSADATRKNIIVADLLSQKKSLKQVRFEIASNRLTDRWTTPDPLAILWLIGFNSIEQLPRGFITVLDRKPAPICGETQISRSTMSVEEAIRHCGLRFRHTLLCRDEPVIEGNLVVCRNSDAMKVTPSQRMMSFWITSES
jgi:hypothetical protein